MKFDAIRVQSEVKVFDTVFAVLIRHGLVTDRARAGSKEGMRFESEPWRVTDVGYLCLKLLKYDPLAEVTDRPPRPADQ